jgi:hypothetical protein
MRTSSSLTRSEAPDMQGTWGLQQESWDGDSSPGVTEGEPMRTAETEAHKPSRLSMLIVESADAGEEQG